ncbi:unnamed protein product [Rhizophagus irregularis]|nr:unnamed protein product [Rhizophagus irregularis]
MYVNIPWAENQMGVPDVVISVTRINQITNRDTGIPSIAFTRCTVYKKRLATNGCVRSYKITCHDFVLAAQNFISVVEYLALTFRHIVIYSTRI